MKLRQIAELLGAEVLCGEKLLDEEAQSACGSDMMSDVLAYVKDQAVLITGLVNPQVVRTAMMMDMRCVVFVRGKRPTPDMLVLADENHIAVLVSSYRMYEACGKLYASGLGCEA
ncbi:MAG: DRTGG domain-containing protein [Clostridiaceae bacterium]|nr:DRTGG domain-containing protein [Feifaniaceae bacterium]